MRKLFILFVLVSAHLFGQADSISIYFETAKSEISYNQQVALEQFIVNLDEDKYNGFKMYGYADYVGDSSYNKDLSKKRVDAVKDFFISRGVSDQMIITAIAKGELPDKIKNRKGNPKSRRVDIFYAIIDKKNIQPDIVMNDTKQVKEKEENLTENDIPKGLDDISNAEIGDNLILNNLNFKPGSTVLLRSSKPVMKKLLKILKDNPKMKIEIQGHICCYPSSIKHDNIALGRAQTVYKYLVLNGISKKRLQYVDFGASRKLIEPEITEADRIKNRRVEIKILDK